MFKLPYIYQNVTTHITCSIYKAIVVTFYLHTNLFDYFAWDGLYKYCRFFRPRAHKSYCQTKGIHYISFIVAFFNGQYAYITYYNAHHDVYSLICKQEYFPLKVYILLYFVHKINIR